MGASLDAIRAFEAKHGIEFPPEYKGFLAETNGADGWIGDDTYVILWKLEDLAELNRTYGTAKYAPGVFLIGSDGGGEGIAFDMRATPPQVVLLPFVGMDITQLRVVGRNFDEFLQGGIPS